MIDGLERESYFVLEDFLSLAQTHELREDLERRHRAGEFRPAGVGREALLSEVRRDEILWLSDGPPFLWALIETLRQELNHKFYLGLERFEGHYARYPAGGFYQRHRDNISRKDSRVVSLILYLNENWRPEYGGELELELAAGPKRVAPRAGTLVCFLSRELEHEVLLARRPRLSFCGWFHCANVPANFSPG